MLTVLVLVAKIPTAVPPVVVHGIDGSRRRPAAPGCSPDRVTCRRADIGITRCNVDSAPDAVSCAAPLDEKRANPAIVLFWMLEAAPAAVKAQLIAM